METRQWSEVEGLFDRPDQKIIDKLLAGALEGNHKKIIVLDDDPTGVQTVHDVTVITDWSMAGMERGFLTQEPLFFILTNSRSFTEQETVRAHREIAENVLAVSRKLNMDYLIVSRGDSTLRGHYPLETEVLRRTIEAAEGEPVDGEIICPFFREGGRVTVDDIHYVQDQGELIPSGQTEFAGDKTFGYTSSHLGEWVAEKTKGLFPKDRVVTVSLAELRSMDLPGITAKLMGVTGFQKVIVNAVDYCDLQVFCIALYGALARGKHFLYRTAASFVKVLGGITDQPLLTADQLIAPGNSRGGLIVTGSHTKKTSGQLKQLEQCPHVVKVEFNSHLVLNTREALEEEIERVVGLCSALLEEKKTVSLSTRRELLVMDSGDKEDELRMSVAISQALTSIVEQLQVRPSFVIAKGGITSSDIGTKALRVKQAVVAGQMKPGIPVWICGEEGKFPRLPYIIFPGNVGEESTLKEIVEELTR